MYFLLYDAVIFFITLILHAVFSVSGLGGGIAVVPAYISLGIAFPIAATAGLMMNIVSLSIVSAHNIKHRIVMWKLGTYFLIPALVMAPFGELVTHSVPRDAVIIIFVILLSYAFYHVLIKSRESHREKLTPRLSAFIAVPIGAIAGFLSGISGIGGGLIVLPALTFMENDYKKIAGTTGYVALFISAASLISHIHFIDGFNIYLWIIIFSGTVLGGLLASYLIHRFQSGRISQFTGAIILIIITVLVSSLFFQV